jgi:type IV secretion system protein VirB10
MIDPEAHDAGARDGGDGNDAIAPLPGEPGIPALAPRQSARISRKAVLAVGLLLASLVTVLAFSVRRFAAKGHEAAERKQQLAADRPEAASSKLHRFELPPPPTAGPRAAPHVPALTPTPEEVEPIGVHRTGTGGQDGGKSKHVLPEDAPVMLVSTRPRSHVSAGPGGAGSTTRSAPAGDGATQREPNDSLDATARNLEAYQHQLQGLLGGLTSATARATGSTGTMRATGLGTALGGTEVGAQQPGTRIAARGAFGNARQRRPESAADFASMLAHRSLTVPKGTAFNCALETRVISATSGLVGCLVQRNVFGDDGRVLLIERGSHLDGEYRIESMQPGMVRIPVVWTRIRTPQGVVVDIDSPGTGQLGESGIDGYVDKRWGERIGAAMLLSLIDDSVQLVIQNEAGRSSNGQNSTIVLPSTTANTSKLAEKVLDSTINIPPLIYRNQGGIVGIYVARDIDFSSVYALQPSAPFPHDPARGEPQ